MPSEMNAILAFFVLPAKRSLGLALFGGLTSWCCVAKTPDAGGKSPASDTSPARIFFVLPTELVFESGPITASPLQSTEREPILSLCRGEAEPIQLVIEAGKEAVSGIRLEIEDMKSADGALLP